MSTATSSSMAPQPSPSSLRQTCSPPTSLSSPSTTTTPAQPIHAHAHTSAPASSISASASASALGAAAAAAAVAGGGGIGRGAPSPPLQSTLPSQETQRHVDEARAAVVASMGNMLDSELQTRATMLHDNAAALDKQERDVIRATDGLRREREKLAREADTAARKVKELGNVQNWAEVLERGFLVLEETVRLANGGSVDGRTSSEGCSCSDCGSGRGSLDGDSEGMDLDDGLNGKGKGKLDEHGDDMMNVVDGDEGPGTWSDASRSLMEPESSTGTGMAKGSETASLSTVSGDARH